ncbi:ferritin-like domain-containing protein [Undibacterium sp. Jales W-56]|uniref:ferritin-like domain-containing protein n=1 Tax=Undibacterium sp. Jales W-56 TaxID=2897325 RepID=UPI0021D06DA9|nr:ferritin-like domain-containing protein [Undibacterium sp. Jales W-56]MCU6435426.1 ferritin-like domain-containing protein [Undibacterium sp. Jales W-56]
MSTANPSAIAPDRANTELIHAKTDDVRQAALNLLAESHITAKVDGVLKLRQAWLEGRLNLDVSATIAADQPIPGRPEKPELVPPLQVKRRAMNTVEGRAVLIHALAHIEFNAINLALDAIWRFADMPPDYYVDWLQVAQEEAYHFSLLADHLRVLGYQYGDFPAHHSLWELAEKTQQDVLARMALVPRTMEARGLDATPAVRAKLAQAKDIAAAEILDIILRDEIGHVMIGNRWFAYLCELRKLEPVATYAALAQQYRAPQMRGPFNLEARRAAGFSEAELTALQA